MTTTLWAMRSGCLRPRPLATAFAFAVNASGRSRIAPVVPSWRSILPYESHTRRLGQAQGFIMGLMGGRMDLVDEWSSMRCAGASTSGAPMPTLVSGFGATHCLLPRVLLSLLNHTCTFRRRVPLLSIGTWTRLNVQSPPVGCVCCDWRCPGAPTHMVPPELLGPLTGATEKQPAMCPEGMALRTMKPAAGAASEDGGGGQQTLLGQLRAATPARWGLE